MQNCDPSEKETREVSPPIAQTFSLEVCNQLQEKEGNQVGKPSYHRHEETDVGTCDVEWCQGATQRTALGTCEGSSRVFGWKLHRGAR